MQSPARHSPRPVSDGTLPAATPLGIADFRESLDFVEHRQLLDHWLAIRGDGMPRREALDPSAFHRVLRHAGLIEVVGPEPRFRYRLTGSELERRFDRRLSGRFVEEVKSIDYAGYLCGLYRACVDARAPLFVTERSTYLTSYPLTCFRLMLPLAGDDGAVGGILYSTISDSDVRAALVRPVRDVRSDGAFRAHVLRDGPAGAAPVAVHPADPGDGVSGCADTRL